MKIILSIVFAALLFSACDKDKNKKFGVCYCEFVKGNNQQYDLNNLATRQEQQDQCNVHYKNASNFGGGCKLK